MQIVRAINNNIVSCLDENGQEVIVMGKGLGFHAKTCSEISESQIEKMFRMDSQKETDKLKALFSSLPIEYIEVSSQIIAYAHTFLNKRLNANVYVTLTDHIHLRCFASGRGLGSRMCW